MTSVDLENMKRTHPDDTAMHQYIDKELQRRQKAGCKTDEGNQTDEGKRNELGDAKQKAFTRVQHVPVESFKNLQTEVMRDD